MAASFAGVIVPALYEMVGGVTVPVAAFTVATLYRTQHLVVDAPALVYLAPATVNPSELSTRKPMDAASGYPWVNLMFWPLMVSVEPFAQDCVWHTACAMSAALFSTPPMFFRDAMRASASRPMKRGTATAARMPRI